MPFGSVICLLLGMSQWAYDCLQCVSAKRLRNMSEIKVSTREDCVLWQGYHFHAWGKHREISQVMSPFIKVSNLFMFHHWLDMAWPDKLVKQCGRELYLLYAGHCARSFISNSTSSFKVPTVYQVLHYVLWYKDEKTDLTLALSRKDRLLKQLQNVFYFDI